MIYQTDTILNQYFPKMGPNGCATLLPFWTVGRLKNDYIDRSFIIWKLDKWIAKEWVTADMYINSWRMIHEDLGLHVRYLGHIDPSLDIEEDQFAYGHWYQPDGHYYHFTAINTHKDATYDPLGDSLAVASGYIETMRLFTLI